MDSYALVIDPEEAERCLVKKILADDGWQVAEACSVEEVSRLIKSCPWKLIFCDTQLSESRVDGIQGIKLLNHLRGKLGASVQIVMMAPAGKSVTAFESILNGAADYIRKPCLAAPVREISVRARERLIAADRERDLTHHPTSSYAPEIASDPDQLVGESKAISEVYKALARSVRFSKSDAEQRTEKRAPAFLITGETGTGKELVARLIHRHSRYRHGSFVAINCSNLSTELADAELFGCSPGAFTGAAKEEQPGLWELASGGSLFLDEITEAPRAVLPKLLRVLQDGQIKRLGSKRWIKVNAQIIAATNRVVPAEIERGNFREDLYHRLNLFTIHLPPLRERLEDIPLLAMHFARFHSGGSVRLSNDALDLLIRFSKEYAWSGNVRELENIIRRAVLESYDRMIYALDLSSYLPSPNGKREYLQSEQPAENIVKENLDSYSESEVSSGLEARVRRYKIEVLKDTLAICNGNYSRAAKALHISRPTLYRLLKDLGA